MGTAEEIQSFCKRFLNVELTLAQTKELRNMPANKRCKKPSNYREIMLAMNTTEENRKENDNALQTEASQTACRNGCRKPRCHLWRWRRKENEHD